MLVWELDKLVKMLGDEDIKKGFNEITRFKQGENIQGGVITTLQNLYRKSHKLEEYPIEYIISEFLYEMANGIIKIGCQEYQLSDVKYRGKICK